MLARRSATSDGSSTSAGAATTASPDPASVMSTAPGTTAEPVTVPDPGSTIVTVSPGRTAATLPPPSNVARCEMAPSRVVTDSGWNGSSYGLPPGSLSNSVVSSASSSPPSVPTYSLLPLASYATALAPAIGQEATSLRVWRS